MCPTESSVDSEDSYANSTESGNCISSETYDYQTCLRLISTQMNNKSWVNIYLPFGWRGHKLRSMFWKKIQGRKSGPQLSVKFWVCRVQCEPVMDKNRNGNWTLILDRFLILTSFVFALSCTTASRLLKTCDFFLAKPTRRLRVLVCFVTKVVRWLTVKSWTDLNAVSFTPSSSLKKETETQLTRL